MRIAEIIRIPKSFDDLLCRNSQFKLTEPLCFFNDPRCSAEDLRAFPGARNLTPWRGEEICVASFADDLKKRNHA